MTVHLSQDDLCIQAVNTVQITGSKEAAARALNIPVSTLKSRLIRAERVGLSGTVEAVEDAPSEKPRIRVKAYTQETPPEGPIYRVLAIGDLHDAPHLPKDRFRWIGKHVAATQPDRVVQIGDWATLDSMSMHDAPGSRQSNERPSFTQDLDSLRDSLAAYNEGKGGFACPEDITLGNHEYRAQRAADADPKRLGDAMLRVEELFAQWRWKTHAYGEYLFIGGVGFTHVPFNGMGKDYRGKRPENMIGNDSIFSLVFGHTHKRGFWTFPKIGPQRGIDILNLGSAMPHGYVANYARLSTTGWSWGIYDVTIQGGRILSDRFRSMIELQEMYG